MKLFEGPAEFDNEEKYFLCQIDKKYHKNLIYNRIPVTKVPDMHAVKKKNRPGYITVALGIENPTIVWYTRNIGLISWALLNLITLLIKIVLISPL